MTHVATISKRFTFDAAHRIQSLPEGHKCHRLHGHTYEAELVLIGPVGDHGFVVDYAELAKWWDSEVGSVLDHSYLNDIPGLSTSSTEMLAAWILERLRHLPVFGKDWASIERKWVTTLIDRVTVKESSTTWCTVYVDDLPLSGPKSWNSRRS